MPILPHSAFFAGRLADAPPSSLLLGRRNGALDFLIGQSKGQKMAVALDKGNWRSFECSNNYNHFGIIIPDIYFEVEVSSEDEISEADYGYLVRSHDSISIMSQPSRFDGGGQYLIPLVAGLLSGGGETSQSFRTWRVCWGEGADKQALYEPPKKSPDKPS